MRVSSVNSNASKLPDERAELRFLPIQRRQFLTFHLFGPGTSGPQAIRFTGDRLPEGSLQMFPADIIEEVALYVGPLGTLLMTRVCKRFHTILNESPRVWKDFASRVPLALASGEGRVRFFNDRPGVVPEVWSDPDFRKAFRSALVVTRWENVQQGTVSCINSRGFVQSVLLVPPKQLVRVRNAKRLVLYYLGWVFSVGEKYFRHMYPNMDLDIWFTSDTPERVLCMYLQTLHASCMSSYEMANAFRRKLALKARGDEWRLHASHGESADMVTLALSLVDSNRLLSANIPLSQLLDPVLLEDAGILQRGT